MPREKASVKKHVMLTPTVASHLRELSEHCALSEAEIVRQAITARFLFQCRQSPTCATGTGCLCPQLTMAQFTAPTPNRLPEHYLRQEDAHGKAL